MFVTCVSYLSKAKHATGNRLAAIMKKLSKTRAPCLLHNEESHSSKTPWRIDEPATPGGSFLRARHSCSRTRHRKGAYCRCTCGEPMSAGTFAGQTGLFPQTVILHGTVSPNGRSTKNLGILCHLGILSPIPCRITGVTYHTG